MGARIPYDTSVDFQRATEKMKEKEWWRKKLTPLIKKAIKEGDYSNKAIKKIFE